MGARTTQRRPKDLVGGIEAPRYLFLEHLLQTGEAPLFRRHSEDHRSFLVIAGEVHLEFLDESGGSHSHQYSYLQGWHAMPASVYRFANAGDKEAVLLEAGTLLGEVVEADQPEGLPRDVPPTPCIDVSSYTVSKPWGHEIWYTDNLAEPRYALKQIHMMAGHQSSLQSHRQKTETNYVIDGEATVLNGSPAPDDMTAVIDVATLPRAVYRARSGWSSAPQILHRVIAVSDYTSVEVSTPELDDVIRWADDTGRTHGRIDDEHARSKS